MYRLTQFGTVALDYYNQVDAVGSGTTPTAYQPLSEGGALDLYGDQQMHPHTVERVKSVRLRAATEAALQTLYFTLLALCGKRDKLYRETPDGASQWIYARLVEITANRDYQFSKYRKFQDLELRFTTQEAFWHGDETGGFLDDGGVFDDGGNFDTGDTTDLDSSPDTATVTVGTDAGLAPIKALTITVYADSSPITALTIARTDGEILTFNGTIAANESLIIDTGTLQVMNGGADAYDDLEFYVNADMASWFTLEPGDNDITVTFTGGGTNAKIEFNFREAWY